ncbi:tRNA 2-thiocytidine(32) synthetase TtcA [Trichloromonas sp.]|uniref:tRNA 2-thiocytidine(32) synthetase TtcA n=1 Tax=Trichloromonas sp. TaxID=3069249 RepID=UPI002A44C2E8|nr:tRNA 2-thiocytidine(32) synthetase TtcA [Trichloromonas sp.]
MPLIEDQLFRKIRKLTGKAIGDFNLIEDGDRIAVGISGGKDSYTLLHILDSLRRRAPVRYELVAVNVDPGFPGYRKEHIEKHLREHGFAQHFESTDCAEIIDAKLRPGSSYCAFCARLRRGVLYTVADRLGCNKLALGHHLDDVIETLLLNQFYIGTLAAMSPCLLADNGRHTVIRPLVYVEEADIAEFAARNGFPIVCCSCPVVGAVDQKRQRMKQLIAELSRENPQLRRSLLSACGNVQPRHLMDPRLTPFAPLGKQPDIV